MIGASYALVLAVGIIWGRVMERRAQRRAVVTLPPVAVARMLRSGRS